MSVDLPAFHAGTLMVKARPKLFKLGWKQMDNGRMDCIEKVFSNVLIRTIWAGDQLLLNPHKVGVDPDSAEGYIGLDAPEIEQAKNELRPIFDRIVKRNKKQWSKEIEEYEGIERLRGDSNFKFPRSQRYGV